MSENWKQVEQYEERIKDGSAIAIIWTTEYVQQVCPDLDQSDAEAVLQMLLDNFDTRVSITPNVISEQAGYYLYGREGETE